MFRIFFRIFFPYYIAIENMQKIIAQGWFGIVIQPPIQYNPKIKNSLLNEDYIGKIATRETLEKEYLFIKKYLKTDARFSHYVRSSDIALCEIDYSQIEDEEIRNELKEDNKNYQLVMPFLGNGLTFAGFLDRFKQVCNSKKTGNIMSIHEYHTITKALKHLYKEICDLNDMKIFHNDIKPNNLIYMEKENELLMIDYNLSITNKIPHEYATNIKFYQSYYDIYCFLILVVQPFLKVAFTNQEIYSSKLFPFYEECKEMEMDILNTMKGMEATNDRIIAKEWKNKINQFFALSETLKDTPSIANTDDTFCSKKYALNNETQKKKAMRWMETEKKLKEERKSMAMQDINTIKHTRSRSRGGHARRKTKKRIFKKIRKNV